MVSSSNYVSDLSSKRENNNSKKKKKKKLIWRLRLKLAENVIRQHTGRLLKIKTAKCCVALKDIMGFKEKTIKSGLLKLRYL